MTNHNQEMNQKMSKPENEQETGKPTTKIQDETRIEEIDEIINEKFDPIVQEVYDKLENSTSQNKKTKIRYYKSDDDLVIDDVVIPRYLKLQYVNAIGYLSYKRAINPEWCKLKFQSEGCTVISDFTGIYEPIKYTYKGKEFTVTWNEWNKGKRPHRSLIDLNQNIELIDEPKEDGICIHCNRWFKTKKGQSKKRVFNPEWVKKQFEKEDCELLNEYIDGKTNLQYRYVGTDETVNKEKIFTITFTQWRCKGIRKHFKQYGKSADFFNQSKAKRIAKQQNSAGSSSPEA